jgi:L-carnitine CoA-transferase
MTRSAEKPQGGVLEGLRVVHASSTIAGPFAADVMADFGADVIWIENPRFPDPLREDWAVGLDRRNQRTISLNVVTPEGREVLRRLLETTDIFIESSRGGTWAKRGLSDEVLWQWNPALVIAHISGFGQDGDPDYVSRPSYDTIVQAFSGYLHQNGYADRPPTISFPFTADYLTGLFTATASLAAVYRARSTGEGESIDVAMFEVLLRCQGWHLPEYLNTGTTRTRGGNRSPLYAVEGVFECGDGAAIAVHAFGAPIVKKVVEFLDLGYGSDEFPEGIVVAPFEKSCGARLEAAFEQYCLGTTAEDADRELNALGVPCAAVMDYATAVDNPHYLARRVFTEWDTVDGGTMRGVDVMPRFKRNPGRVWRGAPSIGMDNEAILAELGYDEPEIRALYRNNVLRQDGPGE